jgi:hypothetical protein
LGRLDGLRRKKKEEQKPMETHCTLGKICGDDKEVYDALRETMLLQPQTMQESIEELIQKAKDFEKAGDLTRAKVCYQKAGGLAIYEGDVAKVKQCFARCKELSPKQNFKILEVTERAVLKAQEYYQKSQQEKK